MREELPDPEYLQSILDYDPASGLLTWKPRGLKSWDTRFAGRHAFQNVDLRGYHKTNIDGLTHRAHRVAWAIHHGRWPEGLMDHINGVRTDNRIENLRECSPAENSQNAAMGTRNKTGVVGVHYSTAQKRWIAQIAHRGRRLHIGTFRDFDAALSARAQAEVQLGFHPNHGRAR